MEVWQPVRPCRHKSLLQKLCRLLIAIAAAMVHSINMSQAMKIGNQEQALEGLIEEIRQLRFAVHIYAEVVRRLSVQRTESAA